RLWFLHQMEGPSATYNMPTALRLKGKLNQRALTASLADVVARHESLRTVFAEDAEGSYQVILAPAEARPVMEVVRAEAADVRQRVAEAARRPFDLTAEIPLRTWLFEVGPDEHVLLFLVHHIVTDGWSDLVLARDVARAYAARCAGEPPLWEPLPVQYADYALWQRELLGSEGDADSLASRQLTYWKDALADLPEELELPRDRPRPAAATYRGETVAFGLGAELHAGLAALARESRASLFMVVQAAVSTLLSKLGAGADIPIGTPIAGRTDDALDELVGFFVNTLVLRTD
ncbi:hypothetical protein ADK38_44640, partial [Streptomyces varsoviensis]